MEMWLFVMFFMLMFFMLMDIDIDDIIYIIEIVIKAISKLLYTVFIMPFNVINKSIKKRREDKKLFIEKQIELEKIKRQNWENGII